MSKHPIPPEKWKWFGSPGHFICARWCRFHLCTKVGKYLVSTVGEYIHPRSSGASEVSENDWLKKNWPGEDIGCDRKYETMVFEASGTCECGCGLPKIVPHELDMLGCNDAVEATKGHYKLCRKWAMSGG